MGAVCSQDTSQITANQLVFGRTLQGNDRAHISAVALDDPLGAQGWQRHGHALGPGKS